MASELLSASMYGLGAFLAALAAVSIVWSRRGPFGEDGKTNLLVFLVRNGRLIDANPAGQRVLDAFEEPADPMGKLKAYITSQFENATEIFANPKSGLQSFKSSDGLATMSVDASDDALRLQVSANTNAADAADVHSVNAWLSS